MLRLITANGQDEGFPATSGPIHPVLQYLRHTSRAGPRFSHPRAQIRFRNAVTQQDQGALLLLWIVVVIELKRRRLLRQRRLKVVPRGVLMRGKARVQGPRRRLIRYFVTRTVGIAKGYIDKGVFLSKTSRSLCSCCCTCTHDACDYGKQEPQQEARHGQEHDGRMARSRRRCRRRMIRRSDGRNTGRLIGGAGRSSRNGRCVGRSCRRRF